MTSNVIRYLKLELLLVETESQLLLDYLERSYGYLVMMFLDVVLIKFQ